MVKVQSLREDSKVFLLCQAIKKMAYGLEPGAKLPTVNELCEQLDTSRVTLQEALKELERQQIIYRQHSKGIFVSPYLHRKNIGILFDSTNFVTSGASPFWGTLWGLFAQQAHQREVAHNLAHSFHSSFCVGNQMRVPDDFTQRIMEKHFHGVLLIGSFEREMQLLERFSIPCVSFAGPGLCIVKLDMIDFLRQAARKMAEEKCRHLTFLAPSFYSQGDPELSAFLDHIQSDRSLVFDQVSVQFGIPELTAQEQGYRLAFNAFSEPQAPRPDGIVVLDDLLTDGLLAAFRVLGVHIGEDTRVVTHANAGSMILFNTIPGMTVLEFDPSMIVSTMFSLLDTLLSGEFPSSTLIHIPCHVRNPLTT